MNKNEDELRKIKEKTSGFFKGKSRRTISNAINKYRPKIDAAKSLSEPEKNEALKALLNQATNERHIALQNGANSYSHPAWAAAATIESWLFELIGVNSNGVSSVEIIIQELNNRT